MFCSRELQSILLLHFILTINGHYDYFKYSNPHSTFTSAGDNFTTFYLIDHKNVSHVNTNYTPDHYFPKCCPPSYTYEKSDRKCVKNNETSIFEMLGFDVDVNLIKTGLAECEVIVDHVLPLDDVKNLLGNTGVIEYKKETFKLGQYCIDTIENKEMLELPILQERKEDQNLEKNKVILRVCYESDYCTKRRGLRCLKKCCSDGELYFNNTCGLQPEYGFPTENHKNIIVNLTDNFAIFNKKRKCQMHYPRLKDEDVIISENGSISFHVLGVWKTIDVQTQMYCFELGLTTPNAPIQHYLLMCNNFDDRNSIRYKISTIAMATSCAFLLATILVYVFIYKLKKVIHRIVVCYCLAQTIGFATLTHLQRNPEANDTYDCKGLGFLVLFGFLAGFSWLTVMCFDMWRTLGSMASRVGDKNKLDLKKTFYYCLYGWSVPALITTFCYVEHVYHLFPNYLHANIGDYFCLLERVEEGNYGHAVFFLFPVTLAIIANIVFFILTVRYIIEATDNVRRMSDTKKEKKKALFAAKKKTFMALKLFLVMGINWSFEVISTIFDFKLYKATEYLELTLDMFNCCQGIFVFVIFVLKWKLIKSVMEKFKVIVVSSVSKTSSTATTSNSQSS